MSVWPIQTDQNFTKCDHAIFFQHVLGRNKMKPWCNTACYSFYWCANNTRLGSSQDWMIWTRKKIWASLCQFIFDQFTAQKERRRTEKDDGTETKNRWYGWHIFITTLMSTNENHKVNYVLPMSLKTLNALLESVFEMLHQLTMNCLTHRTQRASCEWAHDGQHLSPPSKLLTLHMHASG